MQGVNLTFNAKGILDPGNIIQAVNGSPQLHILLSSVKKKKPVSYIYKGTGEKCIFYAA